MAGSEGVSRSRLIGQLWGDRSERQARGSLRQALFSLRKALAPLGRDVIRTEDERVVLDHRDLDIDARRAEALAGARTKGQLVELQSLYVGPLLDGVDVVDSSFEQWLEPERARLHRMVLDALRGLLELHGDDLLEREKTARVIIALDPSCERTHRALIEVLALRGDRAGALQLYETLRGRLRSELAVEPERETEALASRLRRAEAPKITLSSPGGSLAIAELAPSSVSSRPMQERRRVVVMHLRPHAQVQDPELLHEHRRAALGAAEESASRYLASVHPSGSGSAFLWFGIPKAYGDEVYRALLCAKALLLDNGDWSFGLAAGEVLVDEEMRTVTGPAVERAERLSAAAPAGRLWVHALTAREAEHYFDLNQREVLMGEACEIRTLVSSAGRAPFCGRRSELALLEAAVTAARVEGHGRLVYIRGEAGIGKTRLARRLAEHAEAAGFRSHVARVLDFGNQSRRDALRSLARSVAGLTDDGAEAAAEAVSTHMAADASTGEEAFVRDLLDAPLTTAMRGLLDAMGPEERREGFLEAARALVVAAASRAPRVLIVEDLHWAERDTIAGLGELASIIRGTPTLFVMTTRLEGDPYDAVLRGHVYGLPVTTIELGPLTQDEAREMADQLGASHELFRLCHDRAGGHPLFLEQLLRFGRPDDEALPASVRSLVQARLDQLEPEPRRCLQAASILGQRFTLEALAHLLPEGVVDPIALTRSGMVHRQHAAFVFAHALLRDAIYDTLLARDRRALHVRAGEWFEEVDLLLSAEHLERGNDARAPWAYVQAALHLRGLHQTEPATRAAVRGRGLARESLELAELTLLEAELRLDMGEVEDARNAFEAALNLSPEPHLRARALLGRANLRRITDDLDGARADADAAEEAARSGERLAELARAHFLRGNLIFPSGDAERCLREHRASLALAQRIGRRDLEAAALGGIGDAQYLSGRMRTAADTLDRCLELCRELGLGRLEVANHSQRAIVGVFISPVPEALLELRRSSEAAIRVGAKRAEINATMGIAWALFENGQPEASRQVVTEVRALIHRLGAHRYEQLALSFAGATTAVIDGPEEGLAILESARALAEASGPAFYGAEIYGHIARFSRDEEVRRRALARGEAIIQAGCVGHVPLRFYPVAARVALELDDLPLAERLAERLDTFTRAERLPYTDLHLDLIRAALAARRGSFDEEARRRAADQIAERALAAGLGIAAEARSLIEGGVASS